MKSAVVMAASSSGVEATPSASKVPWAMVSRGKRVLSIRTSYSGSSG